MTTRKTATVATAKPATVRKTRATRKVAETAESDPQNAAGWTYSAPATPKGWESAGTVSLARSERDWHGVTRALWNMGDAAETATTIDKEGNEIPSTSARRYYGARRDAIVSRLAKLIG